MGSKNAAPCCWSVGSHSVANLCKLKRRPEIDSVAAENSVDDSREKNFGSFADEVCLKQEKK